jgi:predicted deacylase
MTSGSKLQTTLAVAGGADADVLDLPLLIANGAMDGPRVAILGGVHGDEYEGIVSTSRIWHDLDPSDLHGTVLMVPVSNPPAFQAGTRTSPIDGLNLARTFPGKLDGTATQRIAHVIAESVIRPSDFLIDLHSAGQHYAMPLLAGAYAGRDALGARCEAAALAFGAPVYWAHPDIAPGRSLSVALDAGVPSMYAECGGGGRVRPADLRVYKLGVRRVLAHLGMLPPEPDAPPAELRLRSTGDVDTWLAVSTTGILVERVALLAPVHAGQTLGEVVDERGTVLETLTAAHDGVVVMARRTARVRPGDGGYMIACPQSDAVEHAS